MSNSTKIIIAVLIMAILGAAGWVIFNKPAEEVIFESQLPPIHNQKPAEPANYEAVTAAQSQIETSAISDPSTAIDQDLQDIDSQMSGLAGDNANIDEAINTGAAQ